MIVWITGASSGLGRATALRFALGGARVVASARSGEALETLARECSAASGRVVPLVLDTEDAAAAAEAVRRIEGEQGAIDCAILNAGTHQPMAADAIDIDAFRRLMNVNVMGSLHCLAALLPPMLARGRGQIALVASVAGYRGLPTALAYGASKSALINMAETLRLELEPRGLDIRLICPGFVRTPLTDKNPFPMPFLMEADLAADRIYRGLQKPGFEITFPRRFTWLLKLMEMLPYRLYFPLVRRSTL